MIVVTNGSAIKTISIELPLQMSQNAFVYSMITFKSHSNIPNVIACCLW